MTNLKESIEDCINYLSKKENTKVVYLGLGGTFNLGKNYKLFGWCFGPTSLKLKSYSLETSSPNRGIFSGDSDMLHYFAPLYSDVARLNGHVPQIKEISRKITF